MANKKRNNVSEPIKKKHEKLDSTYSEETNYDHCDNLIMNSSSFTSLVANNKKLSETVIPKLIKRLIRETVSHDTYTCVPYGDDTYIPGFDGFITNNKINHRFLPLGDCVIEIGAKVDSKRSKAKIESDYEKRKNDASIKEKQNKAYIAVTTGTIETITKSNFETDVKKDGIFKQGRILDAVDILDWLTEHVNIFIWFLKQYNKKIDEYSLSLLDDEWCHISMVTKPALTCNLFLISNAACRDKFINLIKLSKENNIITLSSYDYGRDYAFYFCVSTLMMCDDESIRNRVIVVGSQSGLDYVNFYCKGKIILINFNCTYDRFEKNLTNTYVFFDNIFNMDDDSFIKLGRINRNEFVDEVSIIMGNKNDETIRLSYLVDFNPLALRRYLTHIPSVKIPFWSREKDKYDLAPLLILDKIFMDNYVDLVFLKQIIGEDYETYTEKLNIWSEMNQSPISKGESYYKINCRDECFNYLQIDTFSKKILKMEELIAYLLLNSNDEIIGKYGSGFNENRMIRVIENVLDGFIILCNKNSCWQAHFDYYVEEILSNLSGKYELLERNIKFNLKLVELSPRVYLSFLKKGMMNKTFIDYLNKEKDDSYYPKRNYYNFLEAVEELLCNEKFAFDAFQLLIDFYYYFDGEYIFEELFKYLTPIGTLAGLIAIPLSKKIEIFFKLIEKKDELKTKKIIEKLYDFQNDSIMIPVRYTYGKHYCNNIEVTILEIIEMKNKAFDWILNHSKDCDEKMKTLKSLLNNIHIIDYSTNSRQLLSFKDNILGEGDDFKAKAIMEIMETRENILKFSDWNKLKIYIELFDAVIEELKPLDEYNQKKYILINDEYPLLNPPCFDDDDWYEKTNKLREERMIKTLDEIYEKYGEDIVEIIIRDTSINSYLIFDLLFKKSKNHSRDISMMIKNNKTIGVRRYLSLLDEKELFGILDEFKNESIIFKNLPFKTTVFEWVFGKDKENEYWENQRLIPHEKVDYEKVFDKFLQFAPQNIVGSFITFYEVDYEHGMRLLNALSISYKDENKRKGIYSESHNIQELVKKMDKKFYSDELSKVEFELLPVLKGRIGDYPIGLKKYFWNNPSELGKLIVKLVKNKESLKSDSLEKELLFDFHFGNRCLIPSEYIVLKKDELKMWALKIKTNGENEGEEIQRMLNNVIINTLACCPMSKNDDVWPIKEVANILEELNYANFENHEAISQRFAITYLNRRGARSIEDGSKEMIKSMQFFNYYNFYKLSHPIVSRALEIIASDYSMNAKFDKDFSTQGE